MKQSYGVGHIHTYASYTQLINNYLILLCLNQQIFFSLYLDNDTYIVTTIYYCSTILGIDSFVYLQALTLFNIQFVLNK